MVAIAHAHTERQIAAVRTLFDEYRAWYAQDQPEDYDRAATFHNLQQELASLPGPYALPAGRLLLATWDDAPAGCIALRPLTASTAEVKRLFVHPAYRGRQVGRRLVERVVDEARRAGYVSLALDTHISMRWLSGSTRAPGLGESTHRLTFLRRRYRSSSSWSAGCPRPEPLSAAERAPRTRGLA